MSTVLILTPIIISNWPAIVVAATGAASALGLVTKHAAAEALQEEKTENSVEVELNDSEVLTKGMATDQQIVLTKGSIEICVKRDERGGCVVCAKGIGHSKVELKKIAEEFTQKLTQCFIYDKVVRELKSKNFQIVNEEVMEDQSLRIHVRRWAD